MVRELHRHVTCSPSLYGSDIQIKAEKKPFLKYLAIPEGNSACRGVPVTLQNHTVSTQTLNPGALATFNSNPDETLG